MQVNDAVEQMLSDWATPRELALRQLCVQPKHVRDDRSPVHFLLEVAAIFREQRIDTTHITREPDAVAEACIQLAQEMAGIPWAEAAILCDAELMKSGKAGQYLVTR